jgi:hypothetical protein
VRQRWKVNKEQLVIDEKERLAADSIRQARVQDLQHKLLLYEQKKLAQAAAEAVAAGQDGTEATVGTAAAAAAAAATAAAASCSGVSRAVSGAWRGRMEGQLAAVASLQSMRSVGYVYFGHTLHQRLPNDTLA